MMMFDVIDRRLHFGLPIAVPSALSRGDSTIVRPVVRLRAGPPVASLRAVAGRGDQSKQCYKWVPLLFDCAA